MTRLPDLSVSLEKLSDAELRELQRSLLMARVPRKVKEKKEKKGLQIEVQTKAKKAEHLKTLSTEELLAQLMATTTEKS